MNVVFEAVHGFNVDCRPSLIGLLILFLRLVTSPRAFDRIWLDSRSRLCRGDCKLQFSERLSFVSDIHQMRSRTNCISCVVIFSLGNVTWKVNVPRYNSTWPPNTRSSKITKAQTWPLMPLICVNTRHTSGQTRSRRSTLKGGGSQKNRSCTFALLRWCIHESKRKLGENTNIIRTSNLAKNEHRHHSFSAQYSGETSTFHSIVGCFLS